MMKGTSARSLDVYPLRLRRPRVPGTTGNENTPGISGQEMAGPNPVTGYRDRHMKGEDTRMVRCPGCGKPTRYEGNPYRPFCSHRCKMVDLEGWLSGRYRVSSPLDADPSLESEPSPERS